MIEARQRTKRYCDKVAVDNLTFTIQPGIVTGFLDLNGAGKVNDHADDPRPRRADLGDGNGERKAPRRRRRTAPSGGTTLEARAVHTSRSAYSDLMRAVAAKHGTADSRLADVIDMVGL